MTGYYRYGHRYVNGSHFPYGRRGKTVLALKRFWFGEVTTTILWYQVSRVCLQVWPIHYPGKAYDPETVTEYWHALPLKIAFFKGKKAV